MLGIGHAPGMLIWHCEVPACRSMRARGLLVPRAPQGMLCCSARACGACSCRACELRCVKKQQARAQGTAPRPRPRSAGGFSFINSQRLAICEGSAWIKKRLTYSRCAIKPKLYTLPLVPGVVAFFTSGSSAKRAVPVKELQGLITCTTGSTN